MLHIRAYRPQQDFRALLDAQCDLYEINFPRFVCTPVFLADQAQRLRVAGRRPMENGIFILDDDGVVAGFVWVAIRMDLQGAYGSIDQVYLKPAYRRQGYGAWLMQAAEEFIKKQGLKTARLYVTRDNSDAVRLYQRMGYEVMRYEMERSLD
ncbi:MAG: GNAT family N-acetyltransferase [Firmicutes bacterium]|nr:GNAT family N-acetyltransferase [Bacillota bacterium]